MTTLGYLTTTVKRASNVFFYCKMNIKQLLKAWVERVVGATAEAERRQTGSSSSSSSSVGRNLLEAVPRSDARSCPRCWSLGRLSLPHAGRSPLSARPNLTQSLRLFASLSLLLSTPLWEEPSETQNPTGSTPPAALLAGSFSTRGRSALLSFLLLVLFFPTAKSESSTFQPTCVRDNTGNIRLSSRLWLWLLLSPKYTDKVRTWRTLFVSLSLSLFYCFASEFSTIITMKKIEAGTSDSRVSDLQVWSSLLSLNCDER